MATEPRENGTAVEAERCRTSAHTPYQEETQTAALRQQRERHKGTS